MNRALKVFFTITDGAGVRNFIHSGVLQAATGHEVVLWTNSVLIPYIKDSGYPIVDLPVYKSNDTFEILRGSITRAELLRNARKFSDPDFLLYIVKRNIKGWKSRIKETLVSVLGKFFSSDSGIRLLRKRMRKEVERSVYFSKAMETLKQHGPDVVICTHQRSPEAIALVQAARALKIPTMAFIFSWDNLPKGTLMVEADHFLVWSNYMKREVLKYYPWISEQTVHVTGTPQFLPYFHKANYITRERFAETFQLDSRAVWICFSGDDEMTSPYDPVYLKDLATAVTALNAKGSQIQIVFRPSPADISERFDGVLHEFASVIKKVPPQWVAPLGNSWAALIPTAEDNVLLCSIVDHCSAVFNVGSTMAIDFSILDKPSGYFHYNTTRDRAWDIFKVYRFIHFNTMGELDPVYWLNSPAEIEAQIQRILRDDDNKRKEARKWQEVIVASPLDQAHIYLWNAIASVRKIQNEYNT